MTAPHLPTTSSCVKPGMSPKGFRGTARGFEVHRRHGSGRAHARQAKRKHKNRLGQLELQWRNGTCHPKVYALSHESARFASQWKVGYVDSGGETDPQKKNAPAHAPALTFHPLVGQRVWPQYVRAKPNLPLCSAPFKAERGSPKRPNMRSHPEPLPNQAISQNSEGAAVPTISARKAS